MKLILFNKSNFAETEIKAGHLTFSFTTFLLDNIEIVNDALKIAFKKKSVNAPFIIATTFKNNELSTVEKYKLLNLNYHYQRTVFFISQVNPSSNLRK